MSITYFKQGKRGVYPAPRWWHPAFWRFVYRRWSRIRHELTMEATRYERGQEKPKGVFISLPADDGTSRSWDKDRIKAATSAFRKTYDNW